MVKITQILRFLTGKFYKIMLLKINYLIFYLLIKINKK